MGYQYKPTKNAAGHLVLEVWQSGECVLMLPTTSKYPAPRVQERLIKQVPTLLKSAA